MAITLRLGTSCLWGRLENSIYAEKNGTRCVRVSLSLALLITREDMGGGGMGERGMGEGGMGERGMGEGGMGEGGMGEGGMGEGGKKVGGILLIHTSMSAI